MTLAHAAPPIKPCDALGWFRYARHLKDNWQCPGGLDYEKFFHEFLLAVVPDGWIKPGYGPTAQGKQRKDIGKGRAAFLDMYTAGVFDSLAQSRAKKGKKLDSTVRSLTTSSALRKVQSRLTTQSSSRTSGKLSNIGATA